VVDTVKVQTSKLADGASKEFYEIKSNVVQSELYNSAKKGVNQLSQQISEKSTVLVQNAKNYLNFEDDKPPIFGLSLQEAVKYNNDKTLDIPEIVQKLLEKIEAAGIDVEGLFRVSGNQTQIEQLRHYINNNNVDLSKVDIHVASGLLKRYFRELPEPIFDKFTEQLNQATEPNIEDLKKIILQLPRVNRVVLERLMILLVHVVAHSDMNKMNIQSLAIVFSATLRCAPWIINYMVVDFDKIFLQDEILNQNEKKTTESINNSTVANVTSSTTTPAKTTSPAPAPVTTTPVKITAPAPITTTPVKITAPATNINNNVDTKGSEK